MDKTQLLGIIKTALDSGILSKLDLQVLLGDVDTNVSNIEATKTENDSPSKKITNTFYVIGGIIAVIGVIILIAQNWNDIGIAGRILSTLGISFVTYVAGILLSRTNNGLMASVMYAISVVLAPLGSFVLLKEASVNFDWQVHFFTALVLFIIFGTALLISKKSILFLANLGFIAWAYYALITGIFDISSPDVLVVKWATVLIGISYILIAYGYKDLWKDSPMIGDRERRNVQDIVYGIGTLGVLGGGIAIGGLFDIAFIAFVFVAFYSSVFLRSRSMLLLGAVFLIAHIIKLTSRYFVGSIGWPVALIFVGFLVIGVGYMTVYLNRKFISNR